MYELVEVFDILGGANDIELTKMPGGRINKTFVWNAKNVKLFKDGGYSLSFFIILLQ